MNPSLSDRSSVPDLTSRRAAVAQSRPTEWLLVAALGFATVSAVLDGRSWPAAGFAAIGAAALLRASGLPDRSRAWRRLVHVLLALSIALYVLRLILRLRSGGAAF